VGAVPNSPPLAAPHVPDCPVARAKSVAPNKTPQNNIRKRDVLSLLAQTPDITFRLYDKYDLYSLGNIPIEFSSAGYPMKYHASSCQKGPFLAETQKG
jgi:hypothetical protein